MEKFFENINNKISFLCEQIDISLKESIPLSTLRPYFNIKSDYDYQDIWNKYKTNQIGKKGDRLYFDLGQDKEVQTTENTEICFKIYEFIRMTYNDLLSDLFEVPDNIQKIINSYNFKNIKKEEFKNQYYNNSILIDNNNRKIKLGKLFDYLQKLFQLLIDNKIYMYTLKNNTKIYEDFKNDLTKLQKEFINDKSRAKIEQSNEYAVIISRAPYDNLGMSTGRKWDSCVSLIDGNRKQYVPVHIKNGGLVAYLVHKNDKNIDNPVSRARITRFERWDDENKKSIKDNYLLYSGFEVYGFNSEKFHNFIRNWCQENSKHDIDGLYCVAPDEQYAHQAKNIKNKKFDDFENARNERRYNQ